MTKKTASQDKSQVFLALSGKKKKHYEALMAIRSEITKQIDFLSGEALSNLKEGGELSSMSTHMADRGSDAFLRSMELDMLSNEGDLLELVEDAIHKLIDEDSYGICEDCGKDIQTARLEAIPYAKYCVQCKSLREKSGGPKP